MEQLQEKSIVFPNLDITLYDVGDHVDIFGFPVMYYGIIIAVGMLLAGFVILREGRRVGFSEDDLLDVLLWGIVCGIIGARVYYVVFAWDRYSDNLFSIFNIREGGLAIYGGMIGCLLAVIVVAARRKLDFFALADCIILGVPIGQAFGRWGNFFNREAFGGYTNGLLAMRLPVSAVRQDDAVTSEMMDHLITENGIRWIQVHPTFLYESMWSCVVFLILYFIIRRKKKWDGEVFFWYLLLYGSGRFLIEALRTDQLLLPYLGLPVSQCLSALLVTVSIAIIVYNSLLTKDVRF